MEPHRAAGHAVSCRRPGLGPFALVVVALLATLGLLVTAGPALAHTTLRSVTPANASTLPVPPREVVLTFNGAISSTFATVTVTGPGGAVSVGRAVVVGTQVTQALADVVPPGRYAVAYRVVSADGHPVSGTSSFTVAPASPASPTSPTTGAPSPAASTPTTNPSPTVTTPSAAAADPSPDDSSSGRPLRLGLAVGGVALALAAGTALVASTRRRHRP